MNEKILIVVDVQNDFALKNGALYVNNGERCVEAVKALINSGIYSRVIFTVDWHTVADNSFKKFGGQWPVHCVQYTNGAAIVDGLVEACAENRIVYDVFEKGTWAMHEEYGAFELSSKINNNLIGLYNLSHDSYVYVNKNSHFDICGLAGDYCVWETYKNLHKAGLNVTPIYDAIEFIGEKFDYEEKMKN